MAVALVEQAEPKKQGPSMIVQIGLLVGLTIVAIGMGWLTGGTLVSKIAGDTSEKAAGHDSTQSGGHGEDGQASPSLVALEPITVNLAAPTSIWARLELSLVFDGLADAAMA